MAAWLTALVQSWMRDLLGARAEQLLIGRLTWGGVLTAVLFVVLALLAHWIAASLIRPAFVGKWLRAAPRPRIL